MSLLLKTCQKATGKKMVDVSQPCAVEWYKTLRKICAAAMNDESIVLGNTDGAVVEIGKYLWKERKVPSRYMKTRHVDFWHG